MKTLNNYIMEAVAVCKTAEDFENALNEYKDKANKMPLQEIFDTLKLSNDVNIVYKFVGADGRPDQATDNYKMVIEDERVGYYMRMLYTIYLFSKNSVEITKRENTETTQYKDEYSDKTVHNIKYQSILISLRPKAKLAKLSKHLTDFSKDAWFDVFDNLVLESVWDKKLLKVCFKLHNDDTNFNEVWDNKFKEMFNNEIKWDKK